MITRVRIEGEGPTSERLMTEFEEVTSALEAFFAQYGVGTFPGHVFLERCTGSPEVSVEGNWKGRSVVHFDTQLLNGQLDENYRPMDRPA